MGASIRSFQYYQSTLRLLRPKTVEATQVGSTSARLQANIFDRVVLDGNLSFIWGTDPTLTFFTETNKGVVGEPGLSSQLLSGLSPSSTYYYRAKVVNEAGQSDGDSVSVLPRTFLGIE